MPNRKLKVGDIVRVKFTDECYYAFNTGMVSYNEGELYVVIETLESSGSIATISKDGVTNGWSVDYFEWVGEGGMDELLRLENL